MHKPLVTVICLSYNHEQFIQEALMSVVNQSYAPVQIIVVDDASTDNSQAVIQKLKLQHPHLELLLLEQNVGNCIAFNKGYTLAKGDFVIDFATDDVMKTDRIEKQVNYFQKFEDDVGVVFTDADYIDQKGRFLRTHFEYMKQKGLIADVPHGDVYRAVVAKYFIPSPTAMIRRNVMTELGGYDESLSFEDFDLFVRASRTFKFEFLDEKLTEIRKLAGSMSSGWYVPGDKQLMSTYQVCLKAMKLNRDAGDHAALVSRVRYELRQSVMTANHDEARMFYNLLQSLNGIRLIDEITIVASKLRLPLRGLRNKYHRVRFGKTV